MLCNSRCPGMLDVMLKISNCKRMVRFHALSGDLPGRNKGGQHLSVLQLQQCQRKACEMRTGRSAQRIPCTPCIPHTSQIVPVPLLCPAQIHQGAINIH